MVPHEESSDELLEEYMQESLAAVERLYLSCFILTKQGAVRVKELLEPSDVDILKEMQSSDTLSNVLSDFVKYLIDKEDSSIAIPVIQKSVIEKPTNNPCKTLPNVAGQDEIRPSQAEIVEPKSSSESTETVTDASTLGEQLGKDKEDGCDKTGLTGIKTGLTASPRVSRTKLKPKMVKPKKSEIGVWKTVEVKGRRKHQKEKLKHIHEELPAKPKRQKNVNDASRPKHPKHLSQRFHDRNRQWNKFPTSMPFFVTWITYTYAMWILLQHALFL